MRVGVIAMMVPLVIGLDPRPGLAADGVTREASSGQRHPPPPRAHPPPPRAHPPPPRAHPPPPGGGASPSGRSHPRPPSLASSEKALTLHPWASDVRDPPLRSPSAGSQDGGSTPEVEGPRLAEPPTLALEWKDRPTEEGSGNGHRRRGRTLLAGAGLALGVSALLGVAAFRGVQRRCLEPLGAQDPAVTQQAVDLCVASEPALVVAGVGSGVSLAASMAIAAGGGWELGLGRRGRRHRGGGSREKRVRRVLGAVMLGIGLGGVIASRLAFRVGWECEGMACLEEMRRVDLVLRTGAGGLAGIGGAVLAGG